MVKKYPYFIIACLFLMASCTKDEGIELSGDGDYLIFGHFYGECGGEGCVEIFKLEGGVLFEDVNDNYPKSDDFYDGEYLELDGIMYEKVKDLLDYFPRQLRDESATVIGQPDAGDWGGLYIEYKHNGNRKYWLLDQMKSNDPEYLHQFVDKVNEKIALINNK